MHSWSGRGFAQGYPILANLSHASSTERHIVNGPLVVFGQIVGSLCWTSASGCSLPASTFHYCLLEKGHRTVHKCRCGSEFLPMSEWGDAYEVPAS